MFEDKIAGDEFKCGDIFTRNVILGIMWFTWLFIGTCFYIDALDLSVAEGFYMAVNIGYSIGFGDISESDNLGSQWFSTLYVLVGASFVGAALGIFAERIVADKNNWYQKEQESLMYAEKIKDCPRAARMFYFCKFHRERLRPVLLWVLFVIVATFSAWQSNDEYNFTNAVYFAVSSLSTGGHYALPSGNKDWVYGLTGFYCAVGVPLMGMAMATIASFFIDVGTIEEALQDIKAPVTQKEIDMLTEFGLADNDGEIDKGEFIVLAMVRTGAASPDLIKLIEQYFNELDDDKNGTLSLDEILRNREQANSAAKKMLEKVKHGMSRGATNLYASSKNLFVSMRNLKSSKKTTNKPEREEKYDSLSITSGDCSISGSNPMKLSGSSDIYV